MPILIRKSASNASAPSVTAVKPRAVATPVDEGPPAAVAGQGTPSLELEALKRAVESINRRLKRSVDNLRLSLDDDNGKVVIKVVDAATEQLIRQIPSEEALAISRSLERLQGLLLNQEA